MGQNYKLYFAGRQVEFIPDDAIPATNEVQHAVLQSMGKLDTMLLESAINGGARRITFYCSNVEHAWSEFIGQFHFVAAAGGCVVNDLGEVLFIHRLDRWDLPKGKVEPGEDLEVAAVREVEEECSIHDLEVEEHALNTWHTYVQEGVQMIKCTSWYFMRYHGNEIPIPQSIEGITAVKWAQSNEWPELLRNSFPSVSDVIHAYITKRNAAR
jgi:8-oxo-dGTP pyrophosphatase MutT (NUDIX family)